MAWSRLQSASAHGTGNSPGVTATLGSNASSGTKLICAIAFSSASATVTSIQDAAANALTQLALKRGTTQTTGLYAMDTPAGDVGIKPAISVILSSNVDLAILVQEVSGLLAGNTTSMLDGGTVGSLSGTAGSSTGSPSYTSTAASEYLAAVYGDDGGPETYTKPAALTADTNGINSSSLNDIDIAYGNSTNGTEAGSWALTGTTADWSALLTAFKLSATAAPQFPAVIQAVPRPPLPVLAVAPQILGQSLDANPGLPAGTGAALSPLAAIGAEAGLATGTGAALPPSAAIVMLPPVTAAPYRPAPPPVQIPPQVITTGITAVSASAGLATGTGAALSPTVAIAADAGLATGTGAALSPSAAISVPSAVTAAPYRPAPPPVQIPPQIILPLFVPGIAGAGLATAAGTALQPSVAASADLAPTLVQSSFTLNPVPAQIPPQVITAALPVVPGTANAGLATGTGTAQSPQAAIGADAGLATAPGGSFSPGQGASAGLATASGAALTVSSLAAAANAAAATALAAALTPGVHAVGAFTIGHLTGTTADLGALTALTAPGAVAGGVLTAGTQRTGGPG